MVKNLPSNAGDASSIPSLGTKIPHAAGQLLSPCATTGAPHTATGEKAAHYNETKTDTAKNKHKHFRKSSRMLKKINREASIFKGRQDHEDKP